MGVGGCWYTLAHSQLPILWVVDFCALNIFMAQKKLTCFFASSSQKDFPELNVLCESDEEVVSEERNINTERIIWNQEVLLLQFLVALLDLIIVYSNPRLVSVNAVVQILSPIGCH